MAETLNTLETDWRIAETDRRILELRQETDTRIERLVQAIVDLIRNGRGERT